MLEKWRDAVLDNPLSYIIIGAVLAITLARMYVFLGGNTGFTIDGITIHHFFIGAFLLVIIGILSFTSSGRKSSSKSLNKALALFFGLGFGLVLDEANLILTGGQAYTLAQYYSTYNVSFEFGVIAFLLAWLFLSTYLGNRNNANHRKQNR